MQSVFQDAPPQAPSRAFRPGTTTLVALLLCALAPSAHAQRAAADTAQLQRLLVAEDARGTGLDGVAPIVNAVRSEDSLLRRVAARALGRLQRPDLAPLLVGALGDPVAAVRREAANGIAQALSTVTRGAADSAGLGVNTAARALGSALAEERDTAVRDALADALGRLHYADTAEARTAETAIVAAADGRASPGIVTGLYWLAAARRFTGTLSPAAVDLLRTAARSEPEVTARRDALLALNANGTLDSATVFAAGTDRDAQVRRMALFGAAGLSTAARAALVAKALADTSVIVRVQGVTAARAGTARPDCARIVAATSDASAHVSLAAIDALGRPCADPKTAALALTQIIAHPPADPVPNHTWQRPAHALVALARIDSASAASLTPRFAASARWQDRAAAASAAASVGDVQRLTRLAVDTNDNVREAAITGLSRVAGHAADSVYIAALRSRGNQAVLAAATALSGSSDARALPALLDALDRVTAPRSENWRDPRLQILKCIGEQGSATVAARLTPYAADFDTSVARTAAGILSRWTGTPVQPHAKPLPLAAGPLAQTLLGPEARVRVTMTPASGGGSFTVRLLTDDAPATAARILELVRAGYYDGLVFQRVEPDFVIQGGGPGESEYVGAPRFIRDELGRASNRLGTVGMSTRGRDTGDAQWYFNLVDNTRLDHEYGVFGEVVAGWDVVARMLEGDRIERVVIVP